MGCCFSAPRSPKQHPNPQNGFDLQYQSQMRYPEPKTNASHEIDDRPPPLPLEEETVKEVLSETPISKAQVSILAEERSTQMAVIESRAEKFEAKPKGVVKKVEEVSEVSQISEICSINESFSTTTTTTATTTPIAEKREDEATSSSKRLNQPPSSNVPRKRSCSVSSSDGRERRPKSPVRRSETSPEKKKKSQGITRSARGRESGQVATRKVNVGPGRVRRYRKEASGRRSKSPSTRPVSAAGGRSQVKPPAKAVENSESEKAGEKNDDFLKEPQESLDNPLVSMECFIFL